jgi:signal transduction histidine kinase
MRPPTPRLVDAALAAGCLFLTALAVKTPWSTLPLPVIAAAGTAGSLALLVRRRWPVPVAAAGALAHVVSGSPGPLLAGLFTASERSPRRWLPLLAAVGVAGFVGPEWYSGDLDVGAVVSASLLAAAVMALGVYLATRRELIESLRDRTARVEAERRLRDEQARIGERTRIAREMHDVIAHKVALISLHAGALEVGGRGDPDKVEQEAALIRSTAHEALEELRSILGLLRSGEGDAGTAGSGGPAADAASAADHLERLVESWRAAGVTVTLTDDVGAMPAPTARAVHRLVQEGLTNAHKHAPGSDVTVSVAGGRGHDVVVSVTNPAVTADEPAPPGAGVGLVGLDERLRTVGGTLTSGLDATGVWRLEGRLPWTGNGQHGE